jgi:tetratricopeptide (TPR) repeat protein
VTEPRPHIRQVVHAVNGVAYGVIGADLHVFGDGVPLYTLRSWRRAPQASADWLRELPSRMLDARQAVVTFTGRDDELAELRDWRQSAPRLGMRWLHGPAGSGKTRLADEFAAESAAPPVGWKVVTATHGPGTVLGADNQQDLRLDGTAGLLVVVDYADRWPLTHLTWLFSNRIFHRVGAPTRVLLLARGSDAWPAVRAALTDHQPATSSQLLEPLPDGDSHRATMFRAARDSFAGRYELSDPAGIPPPEGLEHTDFGLTLAVHMAALVAVDAHAAGTEPPAGVAGLTVYLLDREHAHWARLYGDGTHEPNPVERRYGTPPHDMNQAVFIAALTGAVAEPAGMAILQRLPLTADPEQVLRDHRSCYPPADPRRPTTLEPLCPDRLAEDFLALTIPGHPADYPTQDWARPTSATLLARHPDGRTAPPWTPRAVTFLAAAAGRWPHVGPRCLFPLLRDDPRLAVDAGGAALTALAAIADVDMDVLSSIDEQLPEDRQIDLDAGIAAVAGRLTEARLSATDDPAEQAELRRALAWRLANAGEHERSLAIYEEAVVIGRRSAEANPGHAERLGAALSGVANQLIALGRFEAALAPAAEVVEIFRRVARDLAGRQEMTMSGIIRNRGTALHHAHMIRSTDLPALAIALNNLGLCLVRVGHREQALAVAEESVAIGRRLAAANAATHSVTLASALVNLSNRLDELGRWADALAVVEEAAEIERRLAAAEPAVHLPILGLTLTALQAAQTTSGRHSEAVAAAQEAIEVARRLTRDGGDAHLPVLAGALDSLGSAMSGLGRGHDALSATHEAVTIRRRLAEANPAAHDGDLARSLTSLGNRMGDLGRFEEALAPASEAVAILRRLAAGHPSVHEVDLASSLNNLSNRLNQVGRPEDALAPAREAVAIHRRRAGADSATQDDGLATSLHSLGITLAALGRPGEALAAAEDAVRTAQRLARADPAAHQRLLAVTLGSLGRRLVQVGRPHDALAPMHEAVVGLRPLVAANPGAFGTELTTMLTNLADLLIQQGRPDDALAPLSEITAIARELAADDPGAHTAGLVRAASMLGDHLSRLGRPAEAVQAYRAAVAAFRGLPVVSSAAERDFATILNNLGQDLLSLERLEEAVAVTSEAVALLRNADAHPARDVELTRSLSNLGLQLSYSDRHDEARAATREAVERYRQSTVEHPAGSDETVLGRALLAFAWTRLSGQPHDEDLLAAVTSATEAVTVYQRLTEARPQEFGADLRTARGVLARAHQRVAAR